MICSYLKGCEEKKWEAHGETAENTEEGLEISVGFCVSSALSVGALYH